MGLLPYSLGFLGPFTTSLPLITLVGFLAIILAMSAHWVYHFIPWASSAHLLLFYLSLFPWVYYLIPWASSAHLLHLYLLSLLWACWPSFLPCHPIELVTSFSLISLIVGLLLPLGLQLKVGINTTKSLDFKKFGKIIVDIPLDHTWEWHGTLAQSTSFKSCIKSILSPIFF